MTIFTCSASAGQQLMRIVVVILVGTKLNYLWYCSFAKFLPAVPPQINVS